MKSSHMFKAIGLLATAIGGVMTVISAFADQKMMEEEIKKTVAEALAEKESEEKP